MLRISGIIEVEGKQNSLFPLEPVIKCLLYPVSLKDSFKLDETESRDALV